MPKARKRKAKTVPSRVAATPTPGQSPANLPLQADPASASLALAPMKRLRAARDRTVLPSNSLIRQKVLAIIAMRLGGKDTDAIAAELHITPASVRQYMWLAGKNGWLSKKAVDPNDRLEYEIAHKVVRNLDEMLDSTDTNRRDLATMKTAEGVLFKKFAEAGNVVPPMAVIGIRIEMPAGANTELREGTTGGTPRWQEGEVVGGPLP